MVKKELEKAIEQFESFDQNIKQMTIDNMNKAPKLENEPLEKLGTKDIEKSKDIYLKPFRTIASREKFNEKFREEYNFSKEYVQFIAEHREIIGETIELWTKPFSGMPAEEWHIPTGKPIWAPRYVAEQIKKCSYHRLTMENQMTGSDNRGQYFGTLVANNTIQRLDALPVGTRKSIFMGAASF